jgi:uncharacterized protein (DUF924 family)
LKIRWCHSAVPIGDAAKKADRAKSRQMNERAETPGRAVETVDSVLAFWRALGRDKWFSRDDEVDAVIRRRFLPTYDAAVAGSLAGWEDTPQSALALLIVLDQFPRNMFRGCARAFAADAQARDVAGRALGRGFDQAVVPGERGFFYLPFMHSEDLADQKRCVALYQATDDTDSLKFALIHADIIRRFGRFPHRNAVLGRETTADEQAFLAAGGFAG